MFGELRRRLSVVSSSSVALRPRGGRRDRRGRAVQVLDALVAKSVDGPVGASRATSSVSVSRSVGTSIVAPKTAG